MEAPTHPIDELRAARRDVLTALQGCTAADLLRPGVEGEWCGRDVLLHIAAWLRELARLIPDLAVHGYQRGEPCDPGPDWAVWNAVQLAPPNLSDSSSRCAPGRHRGHGEAMSILRALRVSVVTNPG